MEFVIPLLSEKPYRIIVQAAHPDHVSYLSEARKTARPIFWSMFSVIRVNTPDRRWITPIGRYSIFIFITNLSVLNI